MNEVSHNTVELITHGIEWLGVRREYLLEDKRRPLPAIRAFPAKFWEDVLKRELEDFQVTYTTPESDVLKVEVQFDEAYIAEDREDFSDYRVTYAYSGIVRIEASACGELLKRGANAVLVQMKMLARDFLELSRAPAASA